MRKKVYAVGEGCVLCATCESECPAGAIRLEPDGARIDPERCSGCGQCADNCPVEIIEARPDCEGPALSEGKETL